jgi:hypothetical protein
MIFIWLCICGGWGILKHLHVANREAEMHITKYPNACYASKLYNLKCVKSLHFYYEVYASHNTPF